MSTRQIIKLILAALAMLGMNVPAQGAITLSKSQLSSIFGSHGLGKMVYVKKSDGYPYIIDFNASSLAESRLCATQANSPLLSPDGKSVAFWKGVGISSGSDCNTNTGTIYLCRAQAGASPVSMGAGFSPHWWIDPGTGYTYIVYHTKGCKVNYPQPGETRKQRIDPDTYARIGSSSLLLDKSFNGGLSKNGKWLATAYNRVYLYDLSASKVYNINNSNQGCNASITPSTDPAKQNRMMHLLLAATFDGTSYKSHETFGVRDHTDKVIWYIVNPPNTVEWQNPEWSTHENYATATAENSGGKYDIYLVKMDTKKSYKFVTGDYKVPHLWVPGSSTAPTKVETPSISPDGGSHYNSVTVTLSCGTSGAAIRYTTNGSTPTSSSTGYTGEITVTASQTITARAFKSGMTDSDVAFASFTITTTTVTLPLKVNVGDNTVSGWAADTPYAASGDFYTSGHTISTSGVAGAGPAEMYKTCRHQGPSFSFSIPDGACTVKLHFCEPHSTNMTDAAGRNMTVKIEGQTVLSNFNPGVAAGGLQKAYVYTKDVTIAGGDGLQIDVEKNGGDAFIMGIEIEENTTSAADFKFPIANLKAETGTVFDLQGNRIDPRNASPGVYYRVSENHELEKIIIIK